MPQWPAFHIECKLNSSLWSTKSLNDLTLALSSFCLGPSTPHSGLLFYTYKNLALPPAFPAGTLALSSPVFVQWPFSTSLPNPPHKSASSPLTPYPLLIIFLIPHVTVKHTVCSTYLIYLPPTTQPQNINSRRVEISVILFTAMSSEPRITLIILDIQ